VSHSNLVLAYHGCDITLRDELLAGLAHLRTSKNTYDWLGTGVYFYEADPDRALEHATTVRNHPERLLASSAIATPAVIGVAIDVSRWLDMSTHTALQEFKIAAETCRQGYLAKHESIPKNGPAFEGDKDNLHRPFDNVTFMTLHGLRAQAYEEAIGQRRFDDAAELRPYQAVRSAFSQGEIIADTSEFKEKNHTQIALIDKSCIKGYFIPVGHQPMQDPAAREAALKELEKAKETRRKMKPRKRA
jgi:hypothetical protein